MCSVASISVVVPVYSGEKYLEKLIEELDAIRVDFLNRQAPFRIEEVILVDDAATDRSPEIIDRIAHRISWVRALHLTRNFGQHAATVAGILHTSGDWVVTIDEDLQHPPREIEALLRRAAVRQDDVVYANASGGVHEAVSRDLASRAFKRLMAALSGDKNMVHFNSFRFIRGAIARAASSVCGHDTYFDVAISWFTTRVSSIAMELKDNRFIETKSSGYSLSRLLTHARRMLMSSHLKALRVGGFFGLLVLVLSFIASICLLVQKFFFPETVNVAGWTSLALIGFFFGGLIVLMIGVVLEYLSLLLLRVNGKPIYFIVDRSHDKIISSYFGLEE